LQFLFGFDALAEVALSGPVAGLENKQVYGIVDRLVVQEAAVWLVDFKSNAQVPESPAEVPLGLLRQMAAYAAVIARTYPDHQIIPALLWTKQARLMPLPDALFETFDSEVKNSDVPVVVDFWAEWCGPCKQIGPALEELSVEMAGKIKIAKVDVDTNPNSAASMGVRGIPALFIFKDGEVISNRAGAAPKAALQSWIEDSI